MDECEALCNRIAIMSAGQFYCIGPITDLKQQFALGFVLSLELSGNSTVDDVLILKNAINDEFPRAVLREEFNVKNIYTLLN